MENRAAKKEIEKLKRQLTACEDRQEKLTEVNEELRLFMYKASHDLKSPFASVAGLATLISHKLNPQSEEMYYFNQITSSMQRLQKTLLDLTEVSKITQEAIKKEKIDFKELLAGVLEGLKNMPGFDRVEPVIVVENYGNYYGDRRILSSVFQNLIVNAIAYHNHRHSQSYYKMEVKGKDDQINITFSDNGIGIEKDLQQKVFDMFYRANDHSQGTGLGLYIVKKGISRLGGKIHLESEFMKGTSFHIKLPRNFNAEVDI